MAVSGGDCGIGFLSTLCRKHCTTEWKRRLYCSQHRLVILWNCVVVVATENMVKSQYIVVGQARESCGLTLRRTKAILVLSERDRKRCLWVKQRKEATVGPAESEFRLRFFGFGFGFGFGNSQPNPNQLMLFPSVPTANSDIPTHHGTTRSRRLSTVFIPQHGVLPPATQNRHKKLHHTGAPKQDTSIFQKLVESLNELELSRQGR